jgi:hypothetical protein
MEFANSNSTSLFALRQAAAIGRQVIARALDVANIERASKFMLSLTLYFGQRFILPLC